MTPSDAESNRDIERERAAATGKDRDLEVLEILERSPDATQRDIARQIGVALGLVNSCLKRMARKGYIKISQVPGRRLLYYLTPKGMSEKTRLTYEYIRYSVEFYREARIRCRERFAELAKGGKVRRVAFLGRGDLAEIAYLTLQEFPLEFAGLYDDDAREAMFFGQPVRPLDEARREDEAFDALVYTRIEPPGDDPALADIDFIEVF